PLATASASAPAARMLFVMGFVIGSSPSLRCSTLAPIAVVPAVIALAAVAGVRAIVLGGRLRRQRGSRGRRARAPPRRRPERGRWTLGRATARRSRPRRQPKQGPRRYYNSVTPLSQHQCLTFHPASLRRRRSNA